MLDTDRTCAICDTPFPEDAGYCPSCGAATPTQIEEEPSQGGHVQVAADREVRERLQRALGDDYQLRELLGRGGFGAVYAAWDVRLERNVAVKALHPALSVSGEQAERFERDARAVAKLRHPNIVPIYTVGERDGLAFMVMPRIEGLTLRDRIRGSGRLQLAEALRLASDVAKALEAAHAAGIIHRDVKPENIVLEEGGAQALLMDFGIAKPLRSDVPLESDDRSIDLGAANVTDSESALTHPGALVGTPLYMSPEQATPGAEVDGRADLYSLTCVLYEMLTGEAPFNAPTPEAIVAQHLNDSPPSMKSRRPEIDEAVDALLFKGLQKDPSLRYQNATAMLEALTAALDRSTATPVVVPQHTGSSEARELYLRSLHRLMRGPRGTREALELLKEALAVDPDYAPALSKLAYIQMSLAFYYVLPSESALAQARAAASRAVEIDPGMPEPHAVLAMDALVTDFDWVGAERRIQTALRCDPTDGRALTAHCWFSSLLGKHEEARRAGEASIEADPASPSGRQITVSSLYYARAFEEATHQAQLLVDLDPEWGPGYLLQGRCYLALGEYGRGIESTRRGVRATRNLGAQVWLGVAYAHSNELGKAEEVLRQVDAAIGTPPIPRIELAQLRYHVGDREGAYTELEIALDRRDPFATTLGVDPGLDPLRDDPRFAALQSRLGRPGDEVERQS